MSAPTYVLELRPLADKTDPRGIRRLRGLLKTALRGWKLKAVSIRPVESEGGR